ncbi:hypothetical protein LJ007_004729 [Salmonella enterica subsp. enterica serovar Typhimurium]|nr:hypothetical protein [Salmonella enterica subsp. enterica serovar Typhimurium]
MARGETITVTMSVTSATATAIPSVRVVRGWGQPIGHIRLVLRILPTPQATPS